MTEVWWPDPVVVCALQTTPELRPGVCCGGCAEPDLARSKEGTVRPSRRTMIRLVLAHAGMVATGLGLLMSASTAGGTQPARAQTDSPTPDPAMRVATFDGQPLSLFTGPSVSQPVVAYLVHDEVVALLGNAEVVDGATRWVAVRTSGNQVGWISDQYLVAMTAPEVAVSPLPERASVPEVVVAEAPTVAPTAILAPPVAPPTATVPPAATPPAPTTTSSQPSSAAEAPSQAARSPAAPSSDFGEQETPRVVGRPLEVEAKVKFPEAKGRHQEVTIWVTRAGVPISGALVTISIEDDEDEPLRVLEPTNEDGRTRREFSIGKEKGSIELIVAAVAPDGGEGRTSVTYFRR